MKLFLLLLALFCRLCPEREERARTNVFLLPAVSVPQSHLIPVADCEWGKTTKAVQCAKKECVLEGLYVFEAVATGFTLRRNLFDSLDAKCG
jgi:hypothetical protein